MVFYPPSVIVPVYAVFSVVGILLLGLRLWTRVALSSFGLGADDGFSVVSVVFVCCCTGIQLWNASAGTGGNTTDDTYRVEQLETASKVNTSQGIIEVLAVGTIKLSLLFFFRRIFGIDANFRRHSLVCIWLIVIWMLAFFIAQMSICGTKMNYLWNYDQTLARDHCGDKALLLLVFAITSVLTDLLVLGLPFTYLKKVQIQRQKKWAAGLIFMLGAVSTFACILRTVFLCIAYPRGTMKWAYEPAPGEHTPVIMQAFNPTFWIMVEMWLGSWAANLLPVGPWLLNMFGRRRGQTRGIGPGSVLSHVYEMGSRRDKTRDVATVEEIDGASDVAPIMGSSRNVNEESFSGS